MSKRSEAIVEILVEAASGESGRPEAEAINQEVQSSLTKDPAYQPLWVQFEAEPKKQAPLLAGILEVVLASDAVLARRLDALLRTYRQHARGAATVNTGGGAYIGGNVSVEDGSFTGRDSITITGDGNVVGDHSRATVIRQEGVGGADLARLFESVYSRIETRPPDEDVDKEEVVEVVEKIEKEAAKGGDANARKVDRWLKTLAMMSDDIFDVTTACLLNPAAGVATVIRKIAAKAREEAGVAEP
jgi:hypothetical protein